MFTPKLLAHASVVALFVLVLPGCGGGGGGGGSSGDNSGGNSTVIDRSNAKHFAAAYTDMLSLGVEALYSAPQLISTLSYITQSTGSQPVDEDFDCTTGSVNVSGSTNAAGTGTITLNYKNCTETDYYGNTTYRYNGKIRITARAAINGYPSAYDYHYDNYRFENLASGTSTGYSGDFSVDSEAGGIRFNASVTLTDGKTSETLATTNYSALYLGSYMPAQVSGTLKQSRWGTVTVGSDGDYRYMRGAQGVLRIGSSYLYDVMHLALDTNNDDIYESFAQVPWDLLDAEATANVAPTVNVSNPGLQPGTNEDVMVPINGVEDTNFDLLGYSVKIVQAPGNADIQLTLLEDKSFSFRTTAPGDYIIALTVDDGRGGVTTQNIAIHASLAAPNVQMPVGSQLINGTLTGANIQPINPEAGPFTYQIVSGPPGMTVDGQGNLNWQAPQNFFDRAEVQVTVKISNADNDVTVPVQFAFTDDSRQVPLVRSGNWGPTVDKNTFVLDFNNDGTSRILLTDNGNLVHTLKYQSGNYVQDWVYPYALVEGSIDHILPIDIDGDGNYEIAVLGSGKINIINEAHDGIARSVDLNMVHGSGLAYADIDNDGHPELVAVVADNMYSYTRTVVVLDAATLTEKWRISGPLGSDFAIGNVDHDAALELVFSGGSVYDGITQANEWTAAGTTFGTAVVVGDVDGDGIDEIIGAGLNTYGLYPTAFSAVSKSVLWDITVDSSTCGLALVQLDGDAAKEIVTSGCSQASSQRVFNATSSGVTQLWSRPQTRGLTSFVAADADNDSDVDLVQIGRDLAGSGHAYLIILDAAGQNVLFDGQGDAEGNFTGAIPAMLNGTRKIVFSSFDSVQSGVTFVTLDPASGEKVQSPAIAGWAPQPPNFCVVDNNNDTNSDVMFGSFDQGWTSFVESYDLLGQAQQWRKTTSYYYSNQPPIACGDFNGDGINDVASYSSGDNMISIDDSSTQLYASNTVGQKLAMGDTDGDGKPELYAAGSSIVTQFSWGAGNVVNSRAYSIPYDPFFSGSAPIVSLTNIGGDPEPEIIISRQSANPFDGTTITRLTLLNSDLTERSSVTYKGFITGIAPEYIGNSRILATVAEDNGAFWNWPIKHRVALIDLPSGSWIWRSPVLVGTPAANSVHYDIAAPNGGSISVGTSSAMYITR